MARPEKLLNPPDTVKLPQRPPQGQDETEKKEPGKEALVVETKKAEAKEKKKPATARAPIRPRRQHRVGARSCSSFWSVSALRARAVAMQDTLPQFESRGSGETTAAIDGPDPHRSQQQVPRSSVQPIAELRWPHRPRAPARAYFRRAATAIATVGTRRAPQDLGCTSTKH